MLKYSRMLVICGALFFMASCVSTMQSMDGYSVVTVNKDTKKTQSSSPADSKTNEEAGTNNPAVPEEKNAPVIAEPGASSCSEEETDAETAAVDDVSCTEREETGNGEVAAESSAGDRKVTDQQNMDDALDLVDQAQILWEEGDLQGALGLLDQSYSLIVEVNGDPTISWQRDDLRYIIAKRILEIYTSRSNVATGKKSEIPLVMNEDVRKEIKKFQGGDRKFLMRSYKRAGRYHPVIVEKLKEAGLPEELSWLPLVESGFKINALSRARALGLWQFISSTGYKFGLKRDHWIDERMDVEKSTRAAIDYLKQLHGIFGDWMTALAAYNCGEGRVLKVISRQHMNYLDNFWDLYRSLPYETACYVPRFLAVLHIMADPVTFGFDLTVKQEDVIPFETVTVKKSMKLKDVARYLKVSEETMCHLNSELRYKTTPDFEYTLKVPAGTASQMTEVYASIPAAKRPGGPEYVRHKVRRGESLSVIAGRYRTSVRAIMAANRLRSKHRITAGRWLKIPVKRGRYVSASVGVSSEGQNLHGKVIQYHVKRGDSLWLLAQRYNTTISNIKSMNGMRGSRLYIGQILKIGNKPTTGGSDVHYTVRRGDSLYEIAKRNKINLNTLLRLNNMSKSTVIHPGEIIRIK